ncbi:acetylornithine deacetylase [Gemmobacter aquatilis]|uniref:Acetylornithine deacetylase n=1 Tax=Gemmobacter aquatilis TaxID=933059 RepID=A0A1H8GZG0_9RHOB|nr:acetylornithine deacetylase [Gemmobacter aquatilis]SEN49383.1 acetylornithine deacetylase [Gemmobacter aquatilis]
MPQRLTPRQILDRLVAFRTVSRDSNLDLVDWVEDYLAGWGVSARRVYNTEGTKAALYASAGPDVAGGVVLSGHTDVVPVDGQDWTTDPWQVVEHDGRLYGRGVCDMKGFDALALAAVPLALERGVKRPLQIALSYDEELGCTGAPPMIAAMAAGLPRASAVVVGEPSMMKLVNGHKGGHGLRVHVEGFEVHSSILHTGVSAIMEGARLIDWANRVNEANRAKQPSDLAALFDPPWTTLHVGTIQGGTAENITARDCSFGMAFRVVPGEDPLEWVARLRAEAARIEAGMQAVRPETRIWLEEKFFVPPLKPETQGAAEALVRRLTGDNDTGVVSYGTEAGQFQAEGYSAVVCGPGDIAQAHQPDEWLAVDQFEAGWRFMESLVEELCQ